MVWMKQILKTKLILRGKANSIFSPLRIHSQYHRYLPAHINATFQMEMKLAIEKIDRNTNQLNNMVPCKQRAKGRYRDREIIAVKLMLDELTVCFEPSAKILQAWVNLLELIDI